MQENTKQVIVKMTARRAFRTEPIWQYDTGHELVFEGFDGLPQAFQVHFSLSPMGQSITQVGQNGVCTLPDMYTRTAAPIYAWLYIAETDTGLTKYSIEIPVQRRAKITDQQPTPVEQSAIDQAIAALNAGAAAAEEAQEAAEAAQASAESYAESAGNSAITATNAATSAAASATSAAGSATAAAASATDANSSREAADVSATAAGVSERNAKSSETAAAGSAASAASSASAASGSATAAGSAKDSAAASATAAAGSATAASGSASAAAESATAAAGSATSAGTSATAAAGSATAAAGSATSAGQSATAAAGSAAAAQEVLESIPEDYSDLSDDVDSLKSALNAIEDEVYTDGTESLANAYTGTTGGSSANVTWGFHLPDIRSKSIELIPYINKTQGAYIAERWHSESGDFVQNDPLTFVESKTANVGESVTFSNVTPNDFFAINVHSISGEIRYSNATTPAHNVPFGYVFNTTGGAGPYVYRPAANLYFAAEKLDITVQDSAIDKKLDSNQGLANAGKVLAVNNEGNVVPVDMPVPEVDATLTVEGEAADSKAVGDVLLDKPVGPELVWDRGYSINSSGEVVSSSTSNAVTDEYLATDEIRVLDIGVKNYPETPGSLTAYIFINTYQSDGTYVGLEYYGYASLAARKNYDGYFVRNLKPGYKYRYHLSISNYGTFSYDEILGMLDIHWKEQPADELGLITRVGNLEDSLDSVGKLETDVDGGGEKITFFIEKGSINGTTGADDTAQDGSVYGRSIGYYEADDNIVISVPVGGRCLVYEYSGESSSDFVRTIGPPNTDGITYVSSPFTVETQSGYYYRFTFKLNDSYTWQDGQEYFKDFSFIKQSTMVEGLKDRVTALEQGSGSDKLFTGKKCVTLGDSITYRNVWQPVVNDALGMTMVNKGIGSTTLSGGDTDATAMSADTRLNGVLSENPDYVTILGGANDLYSNSNPTGYPIGDESEFGKTLENKNRQTFLGAYSYIVEYLLSHDPTLDIMILGTTWAHSDGTRFSQTMTYTMYSDASRKVAQYYGLPFVDLHGEAGFNAFTMGSAAANQIYSSDQIHPNEAGGKRIATLVIAKMIEAWKYTI